MTEVITNPTRDQLVELFTRAAVAANAGGRTRLVDNGAEDRADRVLGESEGCRSADGGGVANAYGYKAETSVLSYAWFTRADGVKVVRVAAKRVGVSGRNAPNLNLGTKTQQEKLIGTCPAALVLNELFGCYSGNLYLNAPADLTPLVVPKGFVNKIKKAPEDLTNWLVLADWLDEHGAPGVAETIRDTFRAPVTA